MFVWNTKNAQKKIKIKQIKIKHNKTNKQTKLTKINVTINIHMLIYNVASKTVINYVYFWDVMQPELKASPISIEVKTEGKYIGWTKNTRVIKIKPGGAKQLLGGVSWNASWQSWYFQGQKLYRTVLKETGLNCVYIVHLNHLPLNDAVTVSKLKKKKKKKK